MTTHAAFPRLFSALSPKAALRLAGSAVMAFALAYRNVAIAGPAAADPLQPKPTAPYSAPFIETATATAADPMGERQEAQQTSIMVMVDHLRRVGFDAVIKSVLIGNPAIADVKMISKREAVIVAKQVGSTNIYFLDKDGVALGDFDVVVREGEARRVVLRRGPNRTALYQCAPRCERTMTQMDTLEAHGALNEVVTKENALAAGAADTGDETTAGAPAQ